MDKLLYVAEDFAIKRISTARQILMKEGIIRIYFGNYTYIDVGKSKYTIIPAQATIWAGVWGKRTKLPYIFSFKNAHLILRQANFKIAALFFLATFREVQETLETPLVQYVFGHDELCWTEFYSGILSKHTYTHSELIE